MLPFEVLKMDNYEYDVSGIPLLYDSDPHEKIHNPLERPEVRFKKPIIAFAGWIVLMLVMFFSAKAALNGFGAELPVSNFGAAAIASVVAGFIYCLVISKKAVIWLVKLYQSRASDAVRLRCVFEPSCSAYMIMAVEKYGAIIGVFKGIIRLFRCHPPNGGKDYP